MLDGGYPTTARLIMASIAKLGFDIRDVKVLLNSEPHPDHGGGLTVLQKASGAQSLLSLDQSFILVWPEVVALVALTVACFAAAYVLFMRQEVRAQA